MQIEVKFTSTEVKDMIREKLSYKHLKVNLNDVTINSDGSITAKCEEAPRSSSYYDR